MAGVNLYFSGLIRKNGPKSELVLNNRAHYQDELNKLKDGTKVMVNITDTKPKRSEQQNRYYWLFLNLIATETGHHPEEIHTWVKDKFLTSKIITVFGEPTRVVGSTTLLSKSDFAELIMKIEEATGIQAPPIEG